MKPWKLALSKLTLDGPYSHHGGLKALAKDIGVLPERITLWMNDQHEPNEENQEKLQRLAENVK